MTDDTPAGPELRADQERALERLADHLPEPHREALWAALAELDRLRAHILELEAAAAVTHGTLAQPTLTPDEPMTIVHDVPPSAPR